MATAQPRFLLKYSKLELALLALIAVGCALRIANVFAHNPMDAIYSDPGRHFDHAVNFPSSAPLSAIDPIGYQVWLAAVLKFTAADKTAIALYAGLLSAITPWFWYRFAREALASRTAAIVVWLAITWLPSWVAIYSYFMTETLLLPLLGASLWTTWRALRTHSAKLVAATALLWTLTTMTRIAVLPLALLCLVAIIYGSARRLQHGLLCAAIIAVLVIPAGLRAQRIIGIFAPFGYPPMNQIFWASGVNEMRFILTKNGARYEYSWGSPTVDQEPFVPLSQWNIGREGSALASIDLSAGSRDWLKAARHYQPPFDRLIHLWRTNAILLTVGNSWPEIFWEGRERTWEWVQMWTRFVWPPLFVALFVGNIWTCRKRRELALLPMGVMLLWLCFVFLPGAPMNGRFRKPLEGLAIVNAVWLVELARQKKKAALASGPNQVPPA